MIGTLVTAVVGCVFLGVGAWWFRSVRARRAWPVTRGTVTGGEIERRTSGVGDDESVSFVPVVRYRYAVSGNTYEGSGLGFGSVGYGSRKTAENIVAKYPMGTTVEVHYDPAKPAQTFLEFRSHTIGWIMLAVGIVVLMVAAVLGYYGV